MQPLITFNHRRIAQAFVDYMATQNIPLEIVDKEDKSEVWLVNESDRDVVENELKRFLQDPFASRYGAASWEKGRPDVQMHYHSQNYWQTLKEKSGWLTLSVMGLCIAIYLLSYIIGIEPILNGLAFPQTQQQAMEFWRWLTPAFIHFSVAHIGFNLILWWYIGGQVEKRLGAPKLLFILIFSALLSNFAQSLFSYGYFGGLSGVVFALIGYAWLLGEKRPEKGIYLERGLMIFSLFWLIIGYFDILGLSIANMAHFIGLVTGLIIALWDSNFTYKKAQ